MLTCVKVERSGTYSERVTPTSGFIKKWAILGLNMASFAIRKQGGIGKENSLKIKSLKSTNKVGKIVPIHYFQLNFEKRNKFQNFSKLKKKTVDCTGQVSDRECSV